MTLRRWLQRATSGVVLLMVMLLTTMFLFRVPTCSASVGEVQRVVAGGAAQGVFPGTADVPPWYVCPSFREVVQGKTQSV